MNHPSYESDDFFRNPFKNMGHSQRLEPSVFLFLLERPFYDRPKHASSIRIESIPHCTITLVNLVPLHCPWPWLLHFKVVERSSLRILSAKTLWISYYWDGEWPCFWHRSLRGRAQCLLLLKWHTCFFWMWPYHPITRAVSGHKRSDANPGVPIRKDVEGGNRFFWSKWKE